MQRFAFSLVLIFLFSITLYAQDEATETFGLPEQPQFGNNSYLRVVQLAAAGDAVDVYLDGERKLFEELAFAEAGVWSTVEAGEHQLTIVASGESPDNPLLQGSFSFGSNQWQTFTIVPVPNTEDLALRIIDDDQSQPLSSTVRTIIVNALPTDTTVNFNRGGKLFFSGFAPFGFDDGIQSYNAIGMDSFVFTLEFTDAASGDVIATAEDTKLIDSNSYIIAASGTANAPEIVIIESRREEVEVAQGLLAAPATLLEALGANGFLQPFVEVVELAGLSETLQSEGPFTMFAPADHITATILRENRDNPEALAEIVRAHLVEGELKSHDLFESEPLTTLAGNEIVVSGTSVNGIGIVDVNIPAVNGTIYIINGSLGN